MTQYLDLLRYVLEHGKFKADCTGAGAVRFEFPVLQDVPQQVEILSHGSARRRVSVIDLGGKILQRQGQSSRFWMLVIGASLELGVWRLELLRASLGSAVAPPASPPSSTANPSPPDRETPASYFAAFAPAGE